MNTQVHSAQGRVPQDTVKEQAKGFITLNNDECQVKEFFREANRLQTTPAPPLSQMPSRKSEKQRHCELAPGSAEAVWLESCPAINKMKGQPSEWEKIFANEATDKELISKIYKQLMQLNIKKATQSKNRPKT